MTERGDLIDAVARYGLRDEATVDDLTADDNAVAFLAATAHEERLTGLLGRAVIDGALTVSASQRLTVANAVTRLAAHSLRVERRLVQIGAGLTDAGIPPVVLKGPGLAHTVYTSPELRPFGDLDLLVAGRDMASAGRVLSSAGFVRHPDELGFGYDERFGKGATYRDDLGYEIDLHRSFTFGPFTPWIRIDDLHERRKHFLVGGHDFACLDAAAAFVHACLHIRLSQFRTINLRDVAELSRRDDLDIDDVAMLCHDWKVGAAVTDAVHTVAATLPVASAITEWVAARSSTDEEVRLLAAHDAADGYRARAWAMLRELRGVDRVRFLAAHARHRFRRRRN